MVFKTYAPFGSNVKRFHRITVHPNLDPSGLYTTRPGGCDPCLYRPQPLHKIFEVNRNRITDKDPWRYKKELEEWAKNLGYRNQKILEQRNWRQTVLGPAWTVVSEPTNYEPACKNVGFGRTPRHYPSKNKIPGPGSYYKFKPYRAPHGPHSTRPTFEREEPCRLKDITPKWSLAPNRYNIIDKASIEQKSKKVVSLRGPYNLFTGKRDEYSIRNHFSKSGHVTAATWPITFKGTLDKYNKSHFGTMNKTNRSTPYRGRNALVDLSMCLRNPEEPGPAHYNLLEYPREDKQNVRGFNSSYDKGPGYKRVVVWPGVGRYSPGDMRCDLPGHGHRHVFLSKLGRTIGAIIQEPMNSF